MSPASGCAITWELTIMMHTPSAMEHTFLSLNIMGDSSLMRFENPDLFLEHLDIYICQVFVNISVGD